MRGRKGKKEERKTASDLTFCFVATSWSGSDIDLCFYGLSDEEVIPKLKEVHKALLKAYPEVPITMLSTCEAVTFARHYPFRPIQVMG